MGNLARLQKNKPIQVTGDFSYDIKYEVNPIIDDFFHDMYSRFL